MGRTCYCGCRVSAMWTTSLRSAATPSFSAGRPSRCHITRRTHTNFCRRVEEGWQANVAVLAIAYRGRFSGSVDLRFDGVGGAEVGFGLAPWARGNGVMTRALRLVLAWGFGMTRHRGGVLARASRQLAVPSRCDPVRVSHGGDRPRAS